MHSTLIIFDKTYNCQRLLFLMKQALHGSQLPFTTCILKFYSIYGNLQTAPSAIMAFKPAITSSKPFKSAFCIFFLLFVSSSLLIKRNFHEPSSESLHSSSAVHGPSNSHSQDFPFGYLHPSAVKIQRNVNKKHPTISRSVQDGLLPQGELTPPCTCSQEHSVTPGTCFDFSGRGNSCNSRECGFQWVCDQVGSTNCDFKTVTSKIVSNGDGTCSTITISIQLLAPVSTLVVEDWVIVVSSPYFDTNAVLISSLYFIRMFNLPSSFWFLLICSKIKCCWTTINLFKLKCSFCDRARCH